MQIMNIFRMQSCAEKNPTITIRVKSGFNCKVEVSRVHVQSGKWLKIGNLAIALIDLFVKVCQNALYGTQL